MFFLNITEKTANVQDKQEKHVILYIMFVFFTLLQESFFTIKYVMFICFISSSVLCLHDANNSEQKESLAM